MFSSCDRKTGCLQKSSAFCCARKRDLLKNDNFEKTIDIFPRIIVIKKLRIFDVYCRTITIGNTGTLSRKLKFNTVPSNDITFQINGDTNLQPGSYISVDVSVQPTKKKLLNQNRTFFVLSEHPDIIWEVPLIVLKKDQEVYVPETICLPKVPSETVSNYQFLVYNPHSTELSFSICSTHERLSIKPISGTIPAEDYSKILITGRIPADQITTSFLLNLKNGKSYKIFVEMESSNQLICLSTDELIFEDTYIGLKSQKNLFVCNKSNECVSFEWGISETKAYPKADHKDDEVLMVSEFVTIRNKRGCIPGMNSILSIFSFTPRDSFQYDEEESTFQINELAYLHCPILGPQSYEVNIRGRIIGPSIEILPMKISVGDLYMGQMHCISFEVLNKGPIPGEIYFKYHSDGKEMNCLVTPLSIHVKPDARKSMQFNFYRRDVGKFLTKLIFKIKSGDFLSILLRGNALPTKVNIFPEVLEFGNIPICIPQRASVTILNSLPISVVVEPKTIDDGVETPLVLCTDNSNLPVNTRSTTYYNRNYGHFVEDLKNSYSDFSFNKETISGSISSDLSSLFQTKVLDDIPAMTTKLLQDFKNIHSKDQLESGLRMIDTSLDCIYNRCDYFQELRNNKNYLNMNWKALPCDAKEIAIEEESFYLQPKETKTFPVVLVPNSSGPSTKRVQFRVHPMDVDNSDFKDTINSLFMVNTLRMQYNCMIPVLEYNNDISFSQPVYVDTEHDFKMIFKNIDIVPGFIYFKVIPSSTSGVVKVEKDQQKFVIAPGEKNEVACSVIFRKVGKIVLHGIFQLVGKLLEYSFKVEAEVLPPTVHISLNKVFAKQDVLELTRTKIFMTNTSPTVAQFSLSLKKDKKLLIEPLGGSLAPNQKILISLFSKFLDPGLYRNDLYINLKHAESLTLPITFSVKGAPLIFEPNIKLGLDFGTLFRSNKLLENIIKITNLGENTYNMNVQQNVLKKLEIIPKSIFSIEPNVLRISPNGQEIMIMQLDLSKEVKAAEEFCVDAVGVDVGKRRFKFSFVAKCNVIEPRVLWSKNELRFEIRNPQSNEDKPFGFVSIKNTTPFTANVSLNVEGNFILGGDCESIKEKSLDFSMEGKTSKEIYVALNEGEIDEPYLMCQCFKGSIKCKVNNRPQKSLPLHVKIDSPGLRICTPEVTLFPPFTDSFAHVSIHNNSLVNASFIWKEVEFKILEKPSSELCVEHLYSKTISELILSMSNDAIPKFPNSIKSTRSLSDSESSDCENLPEMQLSAINAKSSLESSKTASSSSLTSMTSSVKTILQPTECKPILFSKIETQNIGIDQLFQFLGLLEETSLKTSNFVCEGNDLSGGDTKCKDKAMFVELTKIRFQQMSGQIPSKSMFKSYIFLPTLPKGKTLLSKYSLQVIGGQSETLDLTVTSQRGRIQVSKTDIKLGKNIWNKIIVDKIRVTSISQYAIKITIVDENKFSQEKKSSIGGQVEFISPKQFILLPHTSTDVEFRVNMGLCPNFVESVGLEVNSNTTAIPIHFHGSGVFPMVIPTNLYRGLQASTDVTRSYFHLRDLFNIVQRKNNQIHVDKSNDDNESTLSSISSEFNNSARKVTLNQNRNRGFVLLNYPEDIYPGAEDIERSLECEMFLFNLFESNELRIKYDEYRRKCMSVRAMELDPVNNLKLTICRPIPWACCAFVLNMNEVTVNETKGFEIELSFVGPGKLFLSIRTSVVLPGLVASFGCSQKNESTESFAFLLQSPDVDMVKKYKNIHERSSETTNLHKENTETYIPHSHSYDFDEKGVHQRKTFPNDIKKIKEHYTNINQPIKEKKNPLILAEICQTTDECMNNLKLKLYLELTASNAFYERNQVIEDYLFVDVHLGPTVPILLKGKIVPE